MFHIEKSLKLKEKRLIKVEMPFMIELSSLGMIKPLMLDP